MQILDMVVVKMQKIINIVQEIVKMKDQMDI